jgi:hypothetical protein
MYHISISRHERSIVFIHGKSAQTQSKTNPIIQFRADFNIFKIYPPKLAILLIPIFPLFLARYACIGNSTSVLGCFRKCHFGIPRNTEFYTELVLFLVIPRNFLLFNSTEFRGIPCRFVYTEFRIPSNENKGTVVRDLPPPFFSSKVPT